MSGPACSKLHFGWLSADLSQLAQQTLPHVRPLLKKGSCDLLESYIQNRVELSHGVHIPKKEFSC